MTKYNKKCDITITDSDSNDSFDSNRSSTSTKSDEMRLDNKNADELVKSKYFSQSEIGKYYKVDKFFKNLSMEQINKMIDIIEGRRPDISLRTLEWIVTKYAKKRKDIIIQNDEIMSDLFGEKCELPFDIKISYKAQLKHYKKRLFDPFRRYKKFNYYYDKKDNKKCIITTLGQLHFFMWVIEKDIIGYIEKNISQITISMNTSNADEKKKKIEEKTKQKEKEKEKQLANTKNIPAKKEYQNRKDGDEILLVFD
jgi:hypothetical protein